MSEQDDLIQGWLANQATDQLAEYLQRGRRFEARTSDYLRARFVELLRELFKFDNANAQERRDVQAEIVFRGSDLPWDWLTDELKEFRKEMEKRVNQIENDNLAVGFAEFVQKLKGPSN